MSRQIKEFPDMVGLTVKAVYEANEYRLFAFTDGSYAFLASEGYDEKEPPTLSQGVYGPAYGSTAKVFLEAGVFTQQEYDAWMAREADGEARRKAASEEHDRLMYERLKKKFDPQ